MSAALATLNDRPVTACRVQVPAFGLPWAEVESSSPDILKGAATLVLDDVTFKGTILTGGAYQTRTHYRIVGGAGGWGRKVNAKGYTNDLGVKLSTVLADAALACGEKIGPIPAGTVGPSFTRSEGPASRVLEDTVPRGWYVDEAGVTQIGRRPAKAWAGTATRLVNDAAQGRLELAPATIAGLVPGAIVDGVEAVDVEHVLSGADGKLRTTLWGRGIGDTARLPEAFRRIIEAFTARHRYYGTWEYRVVLRSGERLDLQATRVSSGMPDLRAVRIRQGAAGVRVHPALGSLVEVAFLNGDPSRPVVVGFDDQDGAGAVADEIALQAGPTGSTAGAIEHATSAEAVVVAVQAVLTSIGAAITGAGGPGAYLGAVITALAVDATFAGGTLAAMASGTIGATTKTALLAALAAKTADTGGATPRLGWPRVRGG